MHVSTTSKFAKGYDRLISTQSHRGTSISAWNVRRDVFLRMRNPILYTSTNKCNVTARSNNVCSAY